MYTYIYKHACKYIYTYIQFARTHEIKKWLDGTEKWTDEFKK